MTLMVHVLKYCIEPTFVEAVLSVWDLRFGTLQCRQNILESNNLKIEDGDNLSSDHTLQVSYKWSIRFKLHCISDKNYIN